MLNIQKTSNKKEEERRSRRRRDLTWLGTMATKNLMLQEFATNNTEDFVIEKSHLGPVNPLKVVFCSYYQLEEGEAEEDSFSKAKFCRVTIDADIEFQDLVDMSLIFAKRYNWLEADKCKTPILFHRDFGQISDSIVMKKMFDHSKEIKKEDILIGVELRSLVKLIVKIAGKRDWQHWFVPDGTTISQFFESCLEAAIKGQDPDKMCKFSIVLQNKITHKLVLLNPTDALSKVDSHDYFVWIHADQPLPLCVVTVVIVRIPLPASGGSGGGGGGGDERKKGTINNKKNKKKDKKKDKKKKESKRTVKGDQNSFPFQDTPPDDPGVLMILTCRKRRSTPSPPPPKPSLEVKETKTKPTPVIQPFGQSETIKVEPPRDPINDRVAKLEAQVNDLLRTKAETEKENHALVSKFAEGTRQALEMKKLCQEQTCTIDRLRKQLDKNAQNSTKKLNALEKKLAETKQSGENRVNSIIAAKEEERRIFEGKLSTSKTTILLLESGKKQIIELLDKELKRNKLLQAERDKAKSDLDKYLGEGLDKLDIKELECLSLQVSMISQNFLAEVERRKEMEIKKLQEENEGLLCSICRDKKRNCVLLPCKHNCCCTPCAESLPLPRKCPICRSDIETIITVFSC